MTDLTEDEQALEGLLTRYGQALVEAHCPGRHMFWAPLTDDQTTKIGQRVVAILAHYRKAKAEAANCPRCGEVGCMVAIHPDCNGVEKSHFATEDKKES